MMDNDKAQRDRDRLAEARRRREFREEDELRKDWGPGQIMGYAAPTIDPVQKLIFDAALKQMIDSDYGIMGSHAVDGAWSLWEMVQKKDPREN
jgi:hypothetical protein